MFNALYHFLSLTWENELEKGVPMNIPFIPHAHWDKGLGLFSQAPLPP